jgi:hypothetical protein
MGEKHSVTSFFYLPSHSLHPENWLICSRLPVSSLANELCFVWIAVCSKHGYSLRYGRRFFQCLTSKLTCPFNSSSKIKIEFTCYINATQHFHFRPACAFNVSQYTNEQRFEFAAKKLLPSPASADSQSHILKSSSANNSAAHP